MPISLPAGLANVEKLVHQRLNLLAVERAEAVHDVERADFGVAEDFQGVIEFEVRHGGDGHEIDRGLVALVVGVLDHVESRGNLVDVGGHADHVDDALVLGQDVGVVISALGVGHDGDFHGRFLVADDAADVLFVGELPQAELVTRVEPLGGLVAEFHVINAGLRRPLDRRRERSRG